jgi:hypothetical protein
VSAYKAITELWPSIKAWLVAGHQLCIEVKPKTRSLEQNARMWAMLTDVSKQVVWHGRKLTPESWKCVFSASLKKQDVVPGLHGDFVVLGQRTSKMGVKDMGDLMELIEAFGAEKGVRFSCQELEAQ